jgi:hypothetical protein
MRGKTELFLEIFLNLYNFFAEVIQDALQQGI